MNEQTNIEKKNQTLNILRYVFAFVIAGGLIWAYLPTFAWLYDRWIARDSYYAHGFLIPIVTGYWIFKKRKQFNTRESRIDFLGAACFALGFALQLASNFLRIYFLSAFSLVLILLGVIGILFGREVFRKINFPILFLMLAIPLPLLVISQTTLKMKFFVSEVAARLITATGIPAIREGSYVYTPHSFLLVGDPCSGLRSFLAFVCLGFVFAYECQLPFWKRLILVAAGLPLAILSNILRVYSLGVLGEIYGQEKIHGAVHDASGVIVFILAFAAFMALRKQLESSHVQPA